MQKLYGLLRECYWKILSYFPIKFWKFMVRRTVGISVRSGRSRYFRRGFQFIKSYALLNVETKEGLSYLANYFIPFLSLSIATLGFINFEQLTTVYRVFCSTYIQKNK